MLSFGRVKRVELVRADGDRVHVAIEVPMQYYDDGDSDAIDDAFDLIVQTGSGVQTRRFGSRREVIEAYHETVARLLAERARWVAPRGAPDLSVVLGDDAHRVDIEADGAMVLSVEMFARGRSTRELVGALVRSGVARKLKVTQLDVREVVAGLKLAAPSSLAALQVQHDPENSPAPWLPRGFDLTGLDTVVPGLEVLELNVPEVILPALRLPALRYLEIWANLTRPAVESVFATAASSPVLETIVVVTSYAGGVEDAEAIARAIELAETLFASRSSALATCSVSDRGGPWRRWTR